MERLQASYHYCAALTITMLNMWDKLGSIEKGKIADIIAVDGDPLTDVKVMGKVVFVMKEGKVYKKDGVQVL